MNGPDLRSAYVGALCAYVAEASEKALARGRELGRLGVQAGLDSSDIATAHLETLQAAAWPDEITDELVIERSSRFLLETLQPFSTARHRLEQMSRELTEMNDTLIERSKELEIANTELETFSYSISHDLRTSLQAVLGFAQTLDARHSENLPSEARRCIELIIKSARGMNELVDDLLELARAKRLPLELESVDLVSLAREAIGELEPQVAISNADLVIGELPVINADRVLLKRVFVNLISNAIKFSREAEPRARVEIGSMQPNEVPVLFVRDNGVGFDMGQSGRLFQAFERLHRSGDYEGTGVGLALVARIVDRHGGRIWAESELGKGACFYFTLAGEADAASSEGGVSLDQGREEAASGE